MANGKIIPVPSWVRPFLEYYNKSKSFDILRHQIFKAISVEDIKK